MLQSHLLLATGWILFCLFHSLLASSSIKAIPQKWLAGQSQYYRLFYVVFAFGFFVPLIILLFRTPSVEIFQQTIVTKAIGWLVTTGGLIIMLICIRKYFFQLSGLKTLVTESSQNELMITGIHNYVRHPLYTGTFIFIWGLLIVFPLLSVLITNVIITIYTLIGIGFEEKKLQREFGEQYLRYKKKTPMLFPKKIPW